MTCRCELCRACTACVCSQHLSALFPGAEAGLISLHDEDLPACIHPDPEKLLFIFCRRGHMQWRRDEELLTLRPGDYVLCASSAWGTAHAQPSAAFEALFLTISPNEPALERIDLIRESGIIESLQARLRTAPWQSRPGQEEMQRIVDDFCRFGHQNAPEMMQAYQHLKAIELLLLLCRPAEWTLGMPLSAQDEQIHEIHEYLTQNIDRRVTIEELSRRFLLNPTTLKTAFKAVYGTSLAAHIKEHRMELAAQLLRESPLSIAEIAQRVGYESQSRLTAAFKEYFGIPPKEYRHQHSML